MASGTDIHSVERSAAAAGRHLFGLEGASKWLAAFAGWTLLGALGATRLYWTYNFSSPGLVSWTQVFALALTDWYLWGLLSPLIYRLAGRFPLHRGDWLRQVGLHLMLATGFGLVQVTLYTAAFLPVRSLFNIGLATSHQTFTPIWVELLVGKLYVAMMTYLLIAFVSHALHYYRRYREEQQRLALAERNLSEAKLDTLMGQLQPHFLFNTLNAISALVHSDPDAADRMIARLSDLLRMTLEQEQDQFCRLDREIEFVRKYLQIQQVRFADRLTVDINVPSGLEALSVPALILQPLVENAVRHGIAPLSRPGTVTVKAQKVDHRLVLTVADSGPGLKAAGKDSTGRGLRLTRERLAALYPADHSFTAGTEDGGGTVVRIELPLNTAATPGPDQ